MALSADNDKSGVKPTKVLGGQVPAPNSDGTSDLEARSADASDSVTRSPGVGSRHEAKGISTETGWQRGERGL